MCERDKKEGKNMLPVRHERRKCHLSESSTAGMILLAGKQVTNKVYETHTFMTDAASMFSGSRIRRMMLDN